MSDYHEEKRRLREEKREAKQRRNEEKREAKQRHREEKREAKQKFCEAKRRIRDEFKNQFVQSSTPHDNVVVGYPSNPNVLYNNFTEMPFERVEHSVATIRTIFPDCDPEYIRNCLAKETKDHVRKVTEKLLATDYPKVAPVSPLTPPTAPPLPPRSSCDLPFNDEAPPSYEEALGTSSLLQPPPLPKRHQRSSSWNGTPITPTQSNLQQSQSNSQTQLNSRRSCCSNCTENPTMEVSEAIGIAVKNLLGSFKPSTIQQACHKHSQTLMRPVPSRFNPQPLTQIKIIPKDKYSIQRGFNSCDYPPRKLRSNNDISNEDWYFFISGLNSIIGANSIKGSPNNLGEGFSVSLKWVSWMKVTMDEKLMESNIIAINEYLNKWNELFFAPRKLLVEFVDDKTPTSVSTGFLKEKQCSFVQYLLLTSI